MLLNLSALMRTFLEELILLISSFKFFWKLLLIFLNLLFFTRNINSFSKSESSSTIGGHLHKLKPYVSFQVPSNFPRNSKVFHFIRLITLLHISCYDETWRSYMLPKEDPKKLCFVWHTPWVMLTLAFIHWKSANFAVSRITDIHRSLIHNF